MTTKQDEAEAERRKAEMGGSLQEHLDQIRGNKYKSAKKKMNGRGNGKWKKYQTGEARGGHVEAEYIYEDKDGNNYLRVERTENKQFPQSHWDGSEWQYGAPKGPKIPYLLPGLLAAPAEMPVLICEGEKDADSVYCLRLTSEPDTARLISTCTSEGAGKWTKDLNHWFTGKQTVYILEDNDDPGRTHAQMVARNLTSIVGEIHIVSLPDLDEHGDVSNWIEARETEGLKPDQIRTELLRLCAAAPPYQDQFELAPAFSEEDLALRFSRLHMDELRFVAKWGQWYRYDGQRWKPDDTRKTFSLARELCRNVATKAKPRDAKAIANAKTRMAVVSLASDDRRHAATVDQWDADPWLLNTPDGVIDLRNGKVRVTRADDYMTKITSISPDANCPTPLFSAFLDKVTAEDKALQSFLARISGYSLTGLTIEHALFFLYGTGRNGKGVFLNTLIGILGDYHRAAPIETFTATNSEKHPTELAMLRGARLVTSTETEEGRNWAESRIKMLTGGDPVSARFMRQDFFEYLPRFKLVISGNHKPGLRSVDEAIKARFNLIPFAVTIPPEERDMELGAKLVAEYPGILAWMIQGCLEWQKVGLAPPNAVKEATDKYLDSEDKIKRWIEECCKVGPDYWTENRLLYPCYREWCEASGETVGPEKKFRDILETKGFSRVARKERGFAGLTIYIDPDAAQPERIWYPRRHSSTVNSSTGDPRPEPPPYDEDGPM